jgi:hypothetical protein
MKEYAVAMPAGLHGLPRNKVAKRLREGKHHNLFQFYVHAITGDTPQGARVHQWTEDQKQAYIRSKQAG